VKKIILSLVASVLLLVSIACTLTANPEVVDGMVYAKYPKADIMNKHEAEHYRWVYLICDTESVVHVLTVFDSTADFVGSDGSAKVRKDQVIPNMSCGTKLQELQRLAEIGKKHDKKN
jgi:hypothetical protein